jgi:hypothetical protein
MKRFVGVEELAAIVAWLASEDCSFGTDRRLRHFRRPSGTGSVAREATRGAFRFASQGKGEVKIKTPCGTLGAFAVELTIARSGGFHVPRKLF